MAFKIEKSSDKFSALNVQPVFSVIKEVVFSINSNNGWVTVTPVDTVTPVGKKYMIYRC